MLRWIPIQLRAAREQIECSSRYAAIVRSRPAMQSRRRLAVAGSDVSALGFRAARQSSLVTYEEWSLNARRSRWSSVVTQ